MSEYTGIQYDRGTRIHGLLQFQTSFLTIYLQQRCTPRVTICTKPHLMWFTRVNKKREAIHDITDWSWTIRSKQELTEAPESALMVKRLFRTVCTQPSLWVLYSHGSHQPCLGTVPREKQSPSGEIVQIHRNFIGFMKLYVL